MRGRCQGLVGREFHLIPNAHKDLRLVGFRTSLQANVLCWGAELGSKKVLEVVGEHSQIMKRGR